jgi:starvation-inducible DNA-binding protein
MSDAALSSTVMPHEGFTASKALKANLQRVLVDLITLHLQGKQTHWTVVGRNFRDLHLQLDEIVALARQHSDVIAERMRALGTLPDGRTETVATTTSLPVLPLQELDTAQVVDLMTDRLRLAVASARAVHDDVDSEDPTSADLLHVVIDDLEKQAWMLSAEKRGR